VSISNETTRGESGLRDPRGGGSKRRSPDEPGRLLVGRFRGSLKRSAEKFSARRAGNPTVNLGDIVRSGRKKIRKVSEWMTRVPGLVESTGKKRRWG